mgnify:CR=1 FL=1
MTNNKDIDWNKSTEEIVRQVNSLLDKSSDEAYKAGYDCGLNGFSETNTHFSFFCSRENSEAWEHGKRDAERKRS